jgi:hypothetical protein
MHDGQTPKRKWQCSSRDPYNYGYMIIGGRFICSNLISVTLLNLSKDPQGRPYGRGERCDALGPSPYRGPNIHMYTGRGIVEGFPSPAIPRPCCGCAVLLALANLANADRPSPLADRSSRVLYGCPLPSLWEAKICRSSIPHLLSTRPCEKPESADLQFLACSALRYVRTYIF